MGWSVGCTSMISLLYRTTQFCHQFTDQLAINLPTSQVFPNKISVLPTSFWKSGGVAPHNHPLLPTNDPTLRSYHIFQRGHLFNFGQYRGHIWNILFICPCGYKLVPPPRRNQREKFFFLYCHIHSITCEGNINDFYPIVKCFYTTALRL